MDSAIGNPHELKAGSDQLVDLLEAYIREIESNNIKQHTPEWEAIRKFVVGGSSIATFTGDSYGSLIDYVYERLDLGKAMQFGTMPKVIYLNWGNLFENIIERVVRKELSCKIYGENAFIPGYKKDDVMYTCYSPDGLAVYDGKIVLLEFKCPFSRLPVKGGIPKLYLPQVRMGLDMIPVATEGIFVDAVFRKCKITDLNFSATYDGSFKQGLPAGATTPTAIGVILFGNDEFRRGQVIAAAGKKSTVEQMHYVFSDTDFGDAISVDSFETFMLQFEKGIIVPWYSPEQYASDSPKPASDHRTTFNEFAATNKLTYAGCMAWKLFNTKYSQVLKVPNYCAAYLPQIIKTMDFVRESHGKSTAEKKSAVSAWVKSSFPVKGTVRIEEPDDLVF